MITLLNKDRVALAGAGRFTQGHHQGKVRVMIEEVSFEVGDVLAQDAPIVLGKLPANATVLKGHMHIDAILVAGGVLDLDIAGLGTIVDAMSSGAVAVKESNDAVSTSVALNKMNGDSEAEISIVAKTALGAVTTAGKIHCRVEYVVD